MKTKNNATRRADAHEDRIELLIGIIVVLGVIAAVIGLLISAGAKNGRVVAMGEISAPAEIRRGTEQTLTYTSKELKKGDTVTWYVNGQKVAETPYDGQAATLRYTPDEAGQTTVRALCGNCCQTKRFVVKKPLLTLSTTDATITYGDEMPNFTCNVEGFVGGDTAENLNCNFKCCVKENPDVGVWEIEYDGQEPDGYEVTKSTAHLTVLPKTISIANTVTKVYDQTNTVKNPRLVLDGVLDGDTVTAKCDTLYFASKNAGYQKVMTANICLEGENAHNYVLADNAQGYIAPKHISLAGVSVKNKYFDGTTKAQIDNLGELAGVLEGDSIAIGSLDVCFDGANAGKHTASIKGIVLIGVDKDNYVVESTQIADGEIMATK